MSVKNQTNLVRRGNVYQFRKKVPADLRGHYGRESIRESLREFPLLPDAKREAGRRAEAYEAEFAAVRKARSPRPLVPLTADAVPQLAQAFLAHILAADEDLRAEGLEEREFAALEAEANETALTVGKAYARGSVSPIRAQLDDWLTGLGVEADPASAESRALAREFIKARLRAAQGQQARNEGELHETPEAPSLAVLAGVLQHEQAAPPTAAKGRGGKHTLHDLIETWAAAKPKAPRTILTANSLVDAFTKLHGQVPLLEITKAHFVTLRDDMLQHVKPATVSSRFNLLRAAFTVCVEDDKLGLTANPMASVKIRKVEGGEKSRDAFTVAQLQALFDSEVFTQHVRPEGGRGDAAFWAPLLALFTGARLDELLSLRTDGVYEHEGVAVIHFRHRPELGQLLKGKAKNNRRIPIHSELVRLGFLDYFKSVSAGTWLFPDIDRGAKRRSHSSAWGAWFGRYLKRCKIKTDQVTFHSFRHTFKHFARASMLPEDHQDAMTGHTSDEVARRYGSCEGYPVEALAKSMSRLGFSAGSKSLDLSRVSWTPLAMGLESP